MYKDLYLALNWYSKLKTALVKLLLENVYTVNIITQPDGSYKK